MQEFAKPQHQFDNTYNPDQQTQNMYNQPNQGMYNQPNQGMYNQQPMGMYNQPPQAPQPQNEWQQPVLPYAQDNQGQIPMSGNVNPYMYGPGGNHIVIEDEENK